MEPSRIEYLYRGDVLVLNFLTERFEALDAGLFLPAATNARGITAAALFGAARTPIRPTLDTLRIATHGSCRPPPVAPSRSGKIYPFLISTFGRSAGLSEMSGSLTGVPSLHLPMDFCLGVLPSAASRFLPLKAESHRPSNSFQSPL